MKARWQVVLYTTLLIMAFVGSATASETATAAEVSAGLELRLVISKMKVKEQEAPLVVYRLFLVSTGETEVTVLTRSLNAGKSSTPESNVWQADVGMTGTVKMQGFQLVPSLGDFAPVTLRKNECARIELPKLTEDFPGHPFKNLPQNGKISITYRISEEWGKRFGIWHGSVSTPLFEIKDGTILADPAPQKK